MQSCTSADFSRLHRITRSGDFRNLFRRGRRSSSHVMVMLVHPNGGTEPRLGFAIAGKRVRRAVQRNRIKRQVRESFRHHKSQLKGLDIVVLARNGLDKMDNPGIRACLAKHWQQVGQKTIALG